MHTGARFQKLGDFSRSALLLRSIPASPSNNGIAVVLSVFSLASIILDRFVNCLFAMQEHCVAVVDVDSLPVNACLISSDAENACLPFIA